ncbi:hypothetical protein GCM10010222_77400 [Streptomyces tanashiensis]|nr:hypothetical protein GCM10010222_77400 [Streptomyces tanashiensis]
MRQRHRGQGLPHPAGVDPAFGERGVEPFVPAAVFAHQRQFGQRFHGSVPAQNRFRQLEQGVRTGVETAVELAPEA